MNTVITNLNIWHNNIGVEGASGIVNAAPAQMRTVCGDMFEEGQMQANLNDGKLKTLGPEGVVLMSWDLKSGVVRSSLRSLK